MMIYQETQSQLLKNKEISVLLILSLFFCQTLKSQVQCKYDIDFTHSVLINLNQNNFFVINNVKNENSFTIDSFVINKQSIYLSNRVGEFEILNLKKFKNKDTFIIKDFNTLGSLDFIIDYELDLIPDTIYEYKKIKIFRFKVYKNSDKDSLDNLNKKYNEVYETYDLIIGYGFLKYIYHYKEFPKIEILCNCNKKYFKNILKLQKRIL